MFFGCLFTPTIIKAAVLVLCSNVLRICTYKQTLGLISKEKTLACKHILTIYISLWRSCNSFSLCEGETFFPLWANLTGILCHLHPLGGSKTVRYLMTCSCILIISTGSGFWQNQPYCPMFHILKCRVPSLIELTCQRCRIISSLDVKWSGLTNFLWCFASLIGRLFHRNSPY